MIEIFPEILHDAPWLVFVTQGFIYGCILFQAAGLIGDGADHLLLIPSYAPLVGSLVIPFLGAVPDGRWCCVQAMSDLTIPRKG